MTFTVEDFHDLVGLLEAHPEWRGDLRRLLLSDDILELPRIVSELAAAQRRTEQRLEELAEAQQRTEQRLEELAAAQQRTEQRLEQLAEAQRRTEEQLARLTAEVSALVVAQHRTDDRVGKLMRDALERRHRERAPAYFAKLLARIRTLSSNEIADIADDAIERGLLSETDRGELLAADVVVRGRRREDGQEAYLVVEVSSLIAAHDVLRASERAAVLTAITGKPAIPVVAGDEASLDARIAARDRHAWQVLDGVVVPPESQSSSA